MKHLIGLVAEEDDLPVEECLTDGAEPTDVDQFGFVLADRAGGG